MNYEKWKSERIEDLKTPMGYLSMTGLYWLSEGTQSIGSGEQNDIILYKDLPKVVGDLSLRGDQINISMLGDESILIDGEVVKDKILKSDADGTASMFNWKSHFWYVIKRGERYGIRFKDTLADSRINFVDIPLFDPSPVWVIKGTFKPAEESATVSITNKVGITYDSDLAGQVSFQYDNKAYGLTATNSGDDLFIVFADHTNGLKTYGGGRFLYVDRPVDGDEVVLDFNRAENPICGFSDFATCPLPRPENFLPFEVNAGEQKVR